MRHCGFCVGAVGVFVGDASSHWMAAGRLSGPSAPVASVPVSSAAEPVCRERAVRLRQDEYLPYWASLAHMYSYQWLAVIAMVSMCQNTRRLVLLF